MGKGHSSAPPAPDYKGAAEATAQGNLQNLQYQTGANRPNQVTPWGSSTWSAPDAQGHQTETVGLNPGLQQALNSQIDITNGQSNLAQTLQGQAAQRMAGGFNAPQVSSYMSGVPGVNTQFQGFNPSGVHGVQQSLNSSGQNVNTNAQGAVQGAGSVNLNAPQFSNADAQAGAQSAYTAAHSLIADQQHQDTTNLDAQLRLQGLSPGTEAYNNAAQNLGRVQAQQNNNMAAQAVQVGNNEANQNYASSLAGYGAANTAQNQAYNQGANTFALGNTALAQQYGQDANSMSLNNAARGQAYNQALGTYGANATAQQNSNAAQLQAYGQADHNYQTAYSAALQNYNNPLNEMNAVMQGNQVSMPTMPGYATAGYTPGADYSTAAQNLGQYNSAAATAAANTQSGLMGNWTNLATSAMAAY